MQRTISTSRKNRIARKKARIYRALPKLLPRIGLWNLDVEKFMAALPTRTKFDLILTSPPYNLGKEYELRNSRDKYVEWQSNLIKAMIPLVSHRGSICWQVGNYVENGRVEPLDIMLHPIFESAGLQLRNRIVWAFGHGLHCANRFSGRYEVVLWYTKSDDYYFNLDAVRIDPKYPGKRSYRGPNVGKLSSNPNGKNPEDMWWWPGQAEEDIWNIPNVNGNHREKTRHPCQFPVALAERLILALSGKRSLVFDPFAGVGTTGVAAALHGRDFWGCDTDTEYLQIAKERIDGAIQGTTRYRPHDQPLYDHRKSSLSVRPQS